MGESIRRMSVKEFRAEGYLQEVNRQFLHPLGLALEVIVSDDGAPERFGEVWDYRDDPEGMLFGPTDIDSGKAAKIQEEQARMAASRKRSLGYVVQPPPKESP